MNIFTATVSKIKTDDMLFMVTFEFFQQRISMLSLDNTKKLQVGTKVKLGIKPTDIILVKNKQELSSQNQIQCRVLSCENGEILSRVKLEFFSVVFEVIVFLEFAKTLKQGDIVVALIQASDIVVREIVND
ncbi:TOBE [hydrothermal vent metagenome]|uniref:TOBE n=1 Tax=hydrothermal vent metagenome TaxID=652676 RepID=A0A1W1BII2_9ZZZZ